jgi:hypothetical protein
LNLAYLHPFQATENLQKILSKAAPAAARSSKPLTSPCAPLLSTPRNKAGRGDSSVTGTPLGMSASAASPSASEVAEAPLAERLAKANKVRPVSLVACMVCL